MKKQLLALTCALTLGVGGAVAPAAGQSVEPTAQIGYMVATQFGEVGQAAGAGAGGALGGAGGVAVHRHLTTSYEVVRGVSARVAIGRAIAVGARGGAIIGAFGGVFGMAIGAAVGAA